MNKTSTRILQKIYKKCVEHFENGMGAPSSPPYQFLRPPQVGKARSGPAAHMVLVPSCPIDTSLTMTIAYRMYTCPDVQVPIHPKHYGDKV